MNKPETVKLRVVSINYNINEKEGIVTAIERFKSCGVQYDYDFKAIGIAKCNKEDTFNLEIGKKIARAKAEREAYVIHKNNILKEIKVSINQLRILKDTNDALIELIKGQTKYLSTF